MYFTTYVGSRAEAQDCCGAKAMINMAPKHACVGSPPPMNHDCVMWQEGRLIKIHGNMVRGDEPHLLSTKQKNGFRHAMSAER